MATYDQVLVYYYRNKDVEFCIQVQKKNMTHNMTILFNDVCLFSLCCSVFEYNIIPFVKS